MTPSIRPGRVADLPGQPDSLVFADLHIHSRFSRATSSQMEVDALGAWGERKGIGLLGTGDFTHPVYYEDLKTRLEADESGFYRLKNRDCPVRFTPTAEISTIYKQGGKTRRVHTLLIASSLEAVREINRALASRGNVAADGRPIFGFSARHLCQLVRGLDPECLVIPAHIWTPWFSVLGEQSGFDSLAECYEEELPHIAAVETGLSSDPEMNWRLSQLDSVALISNSDAHSPSKIGRECNAFQGPLTASGLREVLRTRDAGRFRFTVEFFPEEGKYHWPGHAKCGPAVPPRRYREWDGVCPVCRKRLTGGVASRVEALADRPEGFRPAGAVPSVHLIPLEEVLSECLGKGVHTKTTQTAWDGLIREGKNELRVLLFMPPEQIREIAGERVAAAVERMRRGDVTALPGYDGIFGKIKVWGNGSETAAQGPQMNLLEGLD